MIHNRSKLATSSSRTTALDCLKAGITAAHPEQIVADAVSYDGRNLNIAGTNYDMENYAHCLIVGGGNATGYIASFLEKVLGEQISGGIVVTDDPTQTEYIDIVAGTHPVPSEQGVKNTRSMMELVDAAGDDTLIITIISGGGSSLLAAPTSGISVSDLQSTTNSLLESGVPIQEINAVRKHISDIKGGQLAKIASPATVVGLVVSDVIGNDLSVIASGPLLPDPTTFHDAIEVVENYSRSVPNPVQDYLEQGVDGTRQETPTDSEPVFQSVDVHLLGDNLTALSAAESTASKRGYETLILSSRVRGEAREVAKTHMAIAEEIRATGKPIEPPAVLLSGGETTVTVTGNGEGGPNQEFAVSSALTVTEEDIVIASVDTDGIDGTSDDAGAIVDAATIDGYEDAAKDALSNNDVYSVLDAANVLIRTGQTGTNVNDLRVIVIPD